MNELRDFGDNKTIVLYTDESGIMRKLSNSTKVFKIIPYEQEQAKRVAIIGFDLYFPKKWKSWVEKRLQATSTQKVAETRREKIAKSTLGCLK